MDIKQLRYFVAVCKYKNFTRAAEDCYISPQGISLSIQRLEDEIGRKLFTRTTKDVQLTVDAEYLLPRVKQMLEILGSCETFFNRDIEAGAPLRVPYVTGAVEEYAGQIIGEFMEQFIRVEAPEMYDFQCEAEVQNGNAELAVSLGPVDPEIFDSRWLYTTKNILVMHKDNPLAKLKEVQIEDLEGVPVVALNPKMRSYTTLKHACRDHGFEPNAAGFVENVMLVYYMAETNKAVGLTTLALYERMHWPNIRHVPFADPVFERKVYAIKKKGCELSRYAEKFEKMLVEYCNSRSEKKS